MSNLLPPGVVQTGEQWSPLESHTCPGSNELVKFDPSKGHAVSAPSASTQQTPRRKRAPKKQLGSVNEYTVGIITALAHEKSAVIAMLDEEHGPPLEYSQDIHDDNAYSWGMMSGHNVVVASLAAGMYGKAEAAHAVNPMLSSLPQMRFGLLVGIGAGIPQDDRDIRLGDVAISVPGDGNGGVYQYDAIKARVNHQVEHRGFLDKPSSILLKGVQELKGRHLREDSDVPEFLETMVETWPKMSQSSPNQPSFLHQGSENDQLFPVDYGHVPGEKNCGKCDPTKAKERPPRRTLDPEFHYGVIASGDTLVKDSIHRDELVSRIPGCICFEMEAAGVMNKLPCLVIRGICDYADSHKNDLWQNYAAAVAAGYAKELLSVIAPVDVEKSKPASVVIQDIKNGMAEIRSTTSKTQDDLQREKLMTWIARPNTSTAYKNARDLHQAGTCHWFLTSEAFQRWKEGHIPLIWIYGIPGSGKTILSSSIIAELEKKPHDPADVVLYFYFGYETTANATFDGMIRHFSADLFLKDKKAQEALQLLHDDNQNGLPKTECLVKTFESMVSHFNQVQIVVDAPDEIEHHKDLDDLLEWIKATALTPKGQIQLIVTSRENEDIKSCLRSLGETVELSKDVVQNDIEMYVEEQLRQSPKLQKWNGHVEAQKAIKSALVEESKGMFRWVFCQLDALRTCYNYEDLLHALKSLPQTLQETYTRILQKIPSNQRQRAITILQLLLFHDGPLSTGMVLDAIIVDPSKPPQRRAFDPKCRFPEPRDLARICGALVTIDWDEVDPLSHKKPSGVFRIAHFSVREYLASDQVYEGFKDKFQTSAANLSFTQISLGYLSHLPISEAYSETIKRYPLTDFAVEWASFARGLQRDKKVANEIKHFFANDAYHSFVRLFNRWDYIKKDDCEEKNAISDHLWIASSLELNDYLATTLSENDGSYLLNDFSSAVPLGNLRPKFSEFDPIARNRSLTAVRTTSRIKEPRRLEESSLYFAARLGWLSIVEALLARNVDVHTEGGRFGTAMNAAMYYGRTDVVMILQKHYDTLKNPKHFTSAVLNTLEHATEYWKPDYLDDWMQHALKRIELSEHDLSGVLRAALLYGHRDLAKLALQNDRTFTPKVNVEATLVDATMFCREHTAKAILDVMDYLQMCSPGEDHTSRTTLTQALIETCDEEYGRSALHWAAYRGFVGLTKDLLSMHADIYLKDRFGKTALHCAAGKGQSEVAQTLIDHGANPKDMDECFRTPLLSALLKGHFQTCWAISPTKLGNPSFEGLLHEIRISAGGYLGRFDLDSVSELYSPYPGAQFRSREWGALYYPGTGHFFEDQRNVTIFRQLVELELHLAEEDSLFRLASRLRRSIKAGNPESVQKVIHSTRGFEVLDARFAKENMSTPLHIAARTAAFEAVGLLIHAGSDSFLRDVHGRTPMHILAEPTGRTAERIRTLETLMRDSWTLDDPDKKGQTCLDLLQIQHECEDGRTCLHFAAEQGCTKIAQALLDVGADLGAQNTDGQTPLDHARAMGYLDIFGIRLDPLIHPSDTMHISNASEARLNEERFAEPQTHTPATIHLALRLHKAVRATEINTVRVLLETPDIDLTFVILRDSTGRSALHWAVENRNLRIVQMLLEVGSAVKYDYEGRRLPHDHHANIKDDEGKTPLHYAAEAGKMKLVEVLVDGKAHTWAIDNQGRTPQELAAIGVSQPHQKVVKWLQARVSSVWEEEAEEGYEDEEENEDEDEDEEEGED